MVTFPRVPAGSVSTWTTRPLYAAYTQFPTAEARSTASWIWLAKCTSAPVGLRGSSAGMICPVAHGGGPGSGFGRSEPNRPFSCLKASGRSSGGTNSHP
jgi:hypothetical protein